MLSCNNCLLPETADATSFDDTGSCSVCRQIEVRDTKIDWDDRHKQMLELVAQYLRRECERRWIRCHDGPHKWPWVAMAA